MARRRDGLRLGEGRDGLRADRVPDVHNSEDLGGSVKVCQTVGEVGGADICHRAVLTSSVVS
ncbi:hypothetical protein ACFPRL_18885 [Pseudoclavibacter helvolus]